MRSILLSLTFTFLFTFSFGEIIDSLTRQLEQPLAELDRINTLNRLSYEYSQFSVDKSRALALDAIIRSEQINYEKGVADGYNNIGICYAISGEIDKGLENFLTALRIREKQKDFEGVAKILNNIAGIFLYQQEYDKALNYSIQSLKVLSLSGNDLAIGNAYLSKGLIWEEKANYDSSMSNFEQAISHFEKINRQDKVFEAKISQAEILEKEGEYQQAIEMCLIIKNKSQNEGSSNLTTDLFHLMGRLYRTLDKQKLSLHYLHRARSQAIKSGSKNTQIKILKTLSKSFHIWNIYDSALYYHELYSDLAMKSLSLQRSKQSAILEKLYENEKKDRQLEASLAQVRSQNLIISIIAVLLLFSILFGTVLFRYYKKKRRINEELLDLNIKITAQKEEITTQANQLNEINQKMELINQNLNQQVILRTRHIIDQNKRLIDYAHLNAHDLRGPLARILGLLNLMDLEPLTEDNRIMVNKIQESASDLDSVVREINERINEDDFELHKFLTDQNK